MTGALALREEGGAVTLKVAARPGASRSAVQGVQGDALKVAIQAPPEKGKANDELVRFLARALGVRRPQVTVVRGDTSRDKVVRVEGLGAGELRTKLAALL